MSANTTCKRHEKVVKLRTKSPWRIRLKTFVEKPEFELEFWLHFYIEGRGETGKTSKIYSEKFCSPSTRHSETLCRVINCINSTDRESCSQTTSTLMSTDEMSFFDHAHIAEPTECDTYMCENNKEKILPKTRNYARFTVNYRTIL